MSYIKPRNFYYLLHPKLVTVVMTLCPNGKVNAMTVAWITPVSEEPPTIAMAIDRETYTYECLEYCREATINIPSANSIELVYKLGTTSGRTIDKIKEFGLKLSPSKKVKVPIWADALGWIEGRVFESHDIGEVRLYILEVVDYYARSDVATEWGWNVFKADLLYHGVGKTFYSLGRFMKAKG